MAASTSFRVVPMFFCLKLEVRIPTSVCLHPAKKCWVRGVAVKVANLQTINLRAGKVITGSGNFFSLASLYPDGPSEADPLGWSPSSNSKPSAWPCLWVGIWGRKGCSEQIDSL